MNSTNAPADILALDDVTVDFGARVGLQNIYLRVRKGEIHALIGDHGAGKSTLVKVLAGVIPKTRGRITFDGRVLEKFTARQAIKLGINTLFQAENLLQNMTASENVFLRREMKKYLFFTDDKTMRERTLAAFNELGIALNPALPLTFYTEAQQQLIELAKIVCFPSKLLMIDEISNKLLPKDLEKLHYLISMLRQGGTTVLYVSRNMDEIFHFANRVTILNKGQIVETTDISNLDKLQLVQLTYSSMYRREQLEKNNLELFYLHNFNRSIIDNLPIPILVADSKGAIVILNRLFARMHEVAEADFIGQPVTAMLNLPDHLLKPAQHRLRDLKTAHLHGVRLKHTAAVKIVDLLIMPCLDEDKSFIGTIYLLNNTGDDAGFEQQLQRYQPASDHHKTLAAVAHEINNPLGIMLNYLQLLKTSVSAADIQMNAGIIEKEIKRVKRILRNLTDVKEAPSMTAKPIPIGDAIAEVAQLLQPQMLSNNIHLRIYGMPELCLHAEPDLLKQVLLNLMLNGIEAMPDGGELGIQLGQTTIEKQGWAVIEISDDGIGIPEALLEKIFEPFFTTKDTSESRGLGLSLSQDIITQLHGSIHVARKAPRGTIFRVLLPDGTTTR